VSTESSELNSPRQSPTIDEDPPELPTKLKLKVTVIREPLSEFPPEDPTKLKLKVR
jgi:hypothetical protein